MTPDESSQIQSKQKNLDKYIKARNRNMIIAYNIKRKLEKSYKRSLICQDVFQNFEFCIKK